MKGLTAQCSVCGKITPSMRNRWGFFYPFISLIITMVNAIASKRSSIWITSGFNVDTPHYSGSVPWLYYTNKRRLTQRQNSPVFPQAKFLQRWGALIQARNIDFTTMKRWMPDYSNSTSIMVSSQKSYTMSADGFISLGLFRYAGASAADARITVTINGKTVGYVGNGAIAANNAKQVNYTNMFPVLVGDVVAVEFSSDVTALTSIYFIPGRWV